MDRLSQRPANAEQRLLQAGLVDDAIAAHLDCQRWEDAIRVAEEMHHLDQEKLRKEYMEHLLTTRQLEQAGKVKEGEGDIQVWIPPCSALLVYYRAPKAAGFSSRVKLLLRVNNLNPTDFALGFCKNLINHREDSTQLLHESHCCMVQTAILHYVNGGLPALAARSVIRNRWGSRLSPDVLEALLQKLGSSSQHDAAGELLEHLQRYDEALDSFRSCAALS